MTHLTPEKRAELRAAVEERHLFRFATERGSDGYPSSGLLEISREVLALLDAADERDRLLTVAHEADQLHAAALAAEGELLGDSPEMPRWERLLLNGLTLPELAKNVADERDRLTAAAERARALHERDELGFCVACDYMTPHPCPTLCALDGTEDPTT